MFEPNFVKLTQKRNIKKLIKLLKHRDGKNRLEAVKLLGNFGDKKAAIPLIEQIGIENESEILENIAIALGKINDADSIDNLMALFFRSGKISGCAFKALELINSDQAVHQLIKEYVKSHELYKNYFEKIITVLMKKRDTAINHLVRILILGSDETNSRFIDIAEKKVIVTILEVLEWQPHSDTEILYYLCAHERWKEIACYGYSGIDILERIKYLFIVFPNYDTKDFSEALAIGYIIAGSFDKAYPIIDEKHLKINDIRKYLVELSRLDAAEFILRSFIEHPIIYGRNYAEKDFDINQNSDYITNVKFYSKLFHDYTGLVLKIFGIKTYYSYYRTYYPLNQNIEALKELCGINSPISNNLLHLISTAKGFTVYEKTSQFGSLTKKVLPINELVKIAKAELANRENPQFLPQVFINSENWFI